YMAPEQAAGQPLGAQADLFSLGCVLYELLTGKKPFTGPTVMAVLNALATHHPTPPREVEPSVPASLSQLTMRLLEKAPQRRPASAGEVSAELRRIEEELAARDGPGMPAGKVAVPVPHASPARWRVSGWVR